MLAEMVNQKLFVIDREITVGSTKHLLGIYQLIKVVRRLAKWLDEEYKPWWAKAVLNADEY